MDKVVGVLGSSGTVGRYVTGKLLSNGVRVVGGQRSAPSLDYGEAFEFFRVDVRETDTLTSFCEKCDIVINCISPVYIYGSIVANIAAQTNTIYIDLTTVIMQEKELPDDGTYVIAGGYVPGLSEYIPRVLIKKEFDSVERMIMYQGGTELCSEAALADIILSADGTRGDKCVRDGVVKPFRTSSEKMVLLPGFYDAMILKASLSKEIQDVGSYFGISDIYAFNVYPSKAVVSVLLNSMNIRFRCADKELAASKIIEQMKEYKNKNKYTPESSYAVLGFEISGVSNGEKKAIRCYMHLKDSGRMCGYMVAEAALSIIKKGIKSGMHFAADILDEGYFERLKSELGTNDSWLCEEIPYDKVTDLNDFIV